MDSRGVIASLLFLAILPVWIFAYLPMTDLSEHMLIAKILVAYDDPQLGYSEYFTRQIPFNPYSTYFWFAALVGPFVGISIATKVYITAALVLTIVAFRMWLRTVAPAQAPNVLPAIPLLFGLFFYVGMISFLFSLPFLLFAVTLGWKVGNGTATAKHVVALAASLLAAWFSHPATFALAVGILGGQALLIFRFRNLKPLLLGLLAPAIAVAGYVYSAGSSDISAFGRAGVANDAVLIAYDPLITRLSLLLMPFGIFQDTATAQWVFQPELAAYWLAFIVCLAVAAARTQAKPESGNLDGVMVVAGLLLVALVVLPSRVGGLPIAMRAAYPAAFALIAVLPSKWYSNRGLRYAVIAACAVTLGFINLNIWNFQPEMRDLQQAIAAIPPRQRIQPIITEPHTTGFRTYPLLHAAAWYSQSKGGISPYLFTSQAHFPVQERGVVIPNPPGEWNMTGFQYDAHQAGTDYFLVRTRDARILKELAGRLPLAAEAGEWKVYGPNSRN